jgi:hypothetical protein
MWAVPSDTTRPSQRCEGAEFHAYSKRTRLQKRRADPFRAWPLGAHWDVTDQGGQDRETSAMSARQVRHNAMGGRRYPMGEDVPAMQCQAAAQAACVQQPVDGRAYPQAGGTSGRARGRLAPGCLFSRRHLQPERGHG